jgi:hypothetical protein
MSTVNASKEQAALYQFFLQQVAAESHFEIPANWNPDNRARVIQNSANSANSGSGLTNSEIQEIQGQVLNLNPTPPN